MAERLPDPENPRVLQRNAAATAFIGILVGLAFQEAVVPVRTSVSTSGPSFVTGCLFLIFLLVSLAAFIAAYYSLILGNFERLGWLLQFSMHVLSSVVLIFMGGVASAEASAAARYGFIDLLFLYALIGAGWSVATLVALPRALRRFLAPYTRVAMAWLAVILWVQLGVDDRYATVPIAVLAAASVLRFLATLVTFWRQRLL
jgi:hypothetical protein